MENLIATSINQSVLVEKHHEKAIALAPDPKLPDRCFPSTNLTEKQYLPMETPPV